MMNWEDFFAIWKVLKEADLQPNFYTDSEKQEKNNDPRMINTFLHGSYLRVRSYQLIHDGDVCTDKFGAMLGALHGSCHV